MAISFKLTGKKNPMVDPPETKYYPVAIHDGEVDLDYIAKRVAMRSTISAADCFGALIALTEVIGEELSDGKIVKLERLGSFQVTLQGTPADTDKDLGKSNIKGARIVYKPSKEMKRTLAKLQFKRIR